MLMIEGLEVDIENIPILRQVQLTLDTGEIVGLIVGDSQCCLNIFEDCHGRKNL